MTYFKSLLFNFLAVFFANHIIPDVQIDYYTKLPKIEGDLTFSFFLGLINSLIFPLMSVATLAYLNFTQYLATKKIGPFITNAYAKSLEKEADLKAAEILCEHGHEYVVEEKINITKI